MKGLKKYMAMAALAVALPASAQTIDFETSAGFSRLGVYDTWEQSPFRTGAIESPERYVGITKNPDTSTNEELGIQPNPSAKVLAVQRSRFGSNTFGARIDLAEKLQMTTATRYVHVMVWKPQGETSNLMLVGLGKRRDWEGQSPETEQFWVASTGTINAEAWTDLVFPISTNEYVDIYSLVFVPDLASPHLRTSDFVAYFDSIEINDNPKTRIASTFYPVNFDDDQAPTRTDRVLNSATFTVSGEAEQTVNADKTRVYNNKTETASVWARPGSTVSVKMSYKGNWMCGYAYVDWDNDGTVLSEKRIPFGQAFKIKMAPAPDFTYTGVKITHGYNLNGPVIDVYLTDALPTGLSRNTINVAGDAVAYSLDGRRVKNPSKGLYIVNDKKVLIR